MSEHPDNNDPTRSGQPSDAAEGSPIAPWEAPSAPQPPTGQWPPDPAPDPAQEQTRPVAGDQGGTTWSLPGTPAPPAYGTPPAPPAYGTSPAAPPAYGTSPAAPPAYGTPAPPPAYGTPPAAPPAYGTPPPPPAYGTPAAYGSSPSPAAWGYPPVQPPYGSRWMPARTAEASSTRTQAIVAMILSIVAVVLCCAPLGIPAAIVSGIAIGRTDTDLRSAKRLVAWGWGLLAASLVIAVLLIVGLTLGGVFDTTTSTNPDFSGTE